MKGDYGETKPLGEKKQLLISRAPRSIQMLVGGKTSITALGGMRCGLMLNDSPLEKSETYV